MPINPQVGNDGVLRDTSGKEVGKVDNDGQVRDGWHDKGLIDSNGRYIDEYGRDMGWTTSGGDSSSGDIVGSAVGGLIVLGVFAGAKYLIDKLSVEGGANQSRYVQLPISKQKAFEICIKSTSTIKRCLIKEQNLTNGIIKTRTGLSLHSWGEVIIFFVMGDDHNSNVEIRSKPVLPTNVLDGGKNKCNVETIANFLLNNFVTLRDLS